MAVLVAVAYLYGIAAVMCLGGLVLYAFAPEVYNRLMEVMS